MLNCLMNALQKMVQKRLASKQDSNFNVIIERTQDRLEQSTMMEKPKSSLMDIDFDYKPNFLLETRKNFGQTANSRNTGGFMSQGAQRSEMSKS